MLTLLFAAILAGSVISTIEFIFIILTCGPFWLSPLLLFETWLINSASIFIGLNLFQLCLHFITPSKKYLSDRGRIYFLYFLFTWTVGCAALTVLVIEDFYAGKGYWTLIIVAAITGIVATILAFGAIKKPTTVPKRTFWISVVLTLLANGVYLISTMVHTANLHQSSLKYDGEVPHLCLLVLDTTRGDHLSCNGYEFETTPNIDRIAGEGLNFTNAFSAANWTPPGHISIFTGKYPPQHGNEGKAVMPDDLLSLTEILHDQGYYCVALYNNPIAGKTINLTQGFDVDVGVWGNCWVYPAWMRLSHKLIFKDNGSRATFPMAYKTFDWVERKGGHLFLYINVTEPHADYLIHEPYFSEFARDIEVDKISDMQKVEFLLNTHKTFINDSTLFADCNDESYKYLRAAYDSEIAYTDHHFGLFAQKLKEDGLLDETFLTITADHGEFLGEHWTLGHPELMFNPVLHIPLIFRYPETIPPGIRNDLVSNVDVFPAVLNLLGLSEHIPDDVSGIDIISTPYAGKRSLISANCSESGGCYSLIKDQTKLIFNDDDYLPQFFPHNVLLFNILDDPEEMMDIHQSEIGVCDTMLTELNEWIQNIRVESKSDLKVSDDTIENLKALGYIN